MKISTTLLAALAASAFAFSPLALHAQDDQGGQPPPPMDNGAPPPPDQQGAPPDQQGAPPPDQGQGGGDDNASFQDFYDNLSSQGQWVQTPDYGYAFQPNVNDPNWAPYTDGHWVYTAYGWTWASDEPWGWATYHYGRWVNIVDTGWCWVPGYTWAPAWVSWRYGGGYCGWAPLPPSTFVGVEFGGPGVNLDFGFHFGGDVDVNFGIGPGCYNFIPVGYIGNPYYHGYYVDRSRNYVIINNTRNITNINVSRGNRGAFGAVRVEGPSLAEVNAHSHTPVQQVRLAATGQAGRSTLSGGTLNVFAPRINPSTLHQGRPATVSRSLSNVQVNRGTSISHPMQVNQQLRAAAPSEGAINAAREAQANAPRSVATASRVAPTASAGAIQRDRTQAVQQQQASTHFNTPGENHTANNQVEHQGGNEPNEANTQAEHNTQVEHQGGNEPNEANTQAEHNAQLEREQAQRQQQTQEQEREASTQQQQHEDAVRQQQNQQQEQEREQANREQQNQQQQQQREEAVRQEQQHAASQQPQQQQQQHFSGGGSSGGGGNSGGGNHYGGGSSGGGNSGGGNHSSGGSSGGGNSGGGNHSSGNGNQNNNNGQGH